MHMYALMHKVTTQCGVIGCNVMKVMLCCSCQRHFYKRHSASPTSSQVNSPKACSTWRLSRSAAYAHVPSMLGNRLLAGRNQHWRGLLPAQQQSCYHQVSSASSHHLGDDPSKHEQHKVLSLLIIHNVVLPMLVCSGYHCS